jgi:ribonucleotide reductase alpha subunit
MIKITKLNKKEDVYDIQVPETSCFYANNILVHNCEIFQVTNEETTAICTLSSMVIKNFIQGGKFNHELLFQEVRKVVRSLNKVIDINNYSTEKGRKGGLAQRAIAIGTQGLADVFYLMDYIFTSEEAKKLNRDIFETIYYAAIYESNQLCMNGNSDSPREDHALQFSPIESSISDTRHGPERRDIN